MLSLPLTCIPSPILRKPLMCCYHRLVFIFYGIIKYSLFGLVSFTDYVSILRVIYVFLCVSSSFFSLLSNIPLYGYTTICLFINMQVWIWVVSSLSLLQITIILFGFFVLIWSWPSETDCTTNVMHVIDQQIVPGNMEGLRRRFPWWPSSKESACNAGATGEKGSVSELGRSPRGGHGNPLQYFCLKNHRRRSLVSYRPTLQTQRVGHD